MLVEFTDSNFDSEVLKSDKPVLVDFWAAWCGPCKMIEPEIKKIAEEKSDVLKVGRLNVDNNRDIAIKYAITSIPTLLLFKNGQVIKKLVGAMSKDRILEEISEFVWPRIGSLSLPNHVIYMFVKSYNCKLYV